jgi:hypothetical protein
VIDKKLKRLNILRTICYAFLLLVCMAWIIDTGFPEFINWPIIIIGSLLLVQMIFRIPGADLVLGILLTMLSFYMLLAVTSDLIDHFNGTKPVSTFGYYFGFGYGIFGVSFAMAVTILYVYYARRRMLSA